MGCGSHEDAELPRSRDRRRDAGDPEAKFFFGDRPPQLDRPELVLEVPQTELSRVREELPGLMTGVAQLAVPLVVDVGAGANWEQAH